MIADGRVALNGVVLDTPATILKSLDGVTVDGEPVQAAEPARLFRYHKPSGLLTAERDFTGRPTIYDRLPKGLPRVMPVGRLDLNTEGLLLLTTDGELKRQLELPSTGVERSYRARAYGHVSQAQLEDLMLGIEIEGVRYGSINANLERRTGTNMWIEMTLTEGKNREVRRVLEHLGLKVSRLIRTRYGPFHLGDLPIGDVDEIRPADLETFRNILVKSGGKTASNLQFAVRQRVSAPAPRPQPVEVERAPRPDNRPGRSGPAAREPERRSFSKAPAPRPIRTPREEMPREAPARAGDQHRARPPRDFGNAPRPVRATRDEAPREASDQRRVRPERSATFTPRGAAPRREQAPREVANPARAARSRAHRENTEPREGDFVDRPRGPAKPPRSGGPAGGRGKPGKGPAGGRGKPARPPKSRK